MEPDRILQAMLSSVVFGVLGLVLFAAAYWLIMKLSPFSVRKEIQEDQNVALAVIIAAFVLGIALIVAAAIH